MKNIILQITFLIFILPNEAQTVTDVDGNTYNTVTIGTQIWLKENLKTTKYNDGTVIPNVTDGTNWSTLTTPAYCWYSNSVSYKSGRGALYNWYVVNTGKICPTNWHVPSYNEWETLVNFLGGASIAGPKMREVGNTYYINNADATNSSGLSMRATGIRFDTGGFDGITFWGGWWATNEANTTSSVIINVDNNYLGLTDNGGYNKKGGIAIRCLKNDLSSVNNIHFSEENIIYPNPASEKIYIKNNNSNKTQVLIFDLNGKLLINKHPDLDFIDISNFVNGIYLVKIYNSGVMHINKLIKK